MKRNLYLNVQEKEAALSRFLEVFSHIQPGRERIPVIHSLGRITAEAVYARYSSPSYNSCAMDGIAVISAHTKGCLLYTSKTPAKNTNEQRLPL